MRKWASGVNGFVGTVVALVSAWPQRKALICHYEVQDQQKTGDANG
jgi:hypothetical protein